MRQQQYFTLAVAAGVTLLHETAAHILLQTPVSRSVSRTVDYLAWDDAQVEFCPHCYNARGPKYVKQRSIDNIDPDVLSQYGGGVEYPLYFGEYADNGNYLETDEIAKRHGICGDPEQNADEGSNAYSTPTAEWDVLESYEGGQVIEMDVVMNAYHWGHCEFFICNTDELDDPDGLPTQECFNKHPLTRASDDGDASPIDPNYPGRYYVDPECREGETEQSGNNVAEGYNIKMRYVLPDIECEHCIVQMVYRTGNTCKHIGYDEYNPSSWPSSCAPAKEDWVELYRYICGTNGQYPEEFWGCSDISISSDGTAPAPTPAVTSEPVAEPTPSPVAEPTPEPVAEPTPSPVAEPTPEPSSYSTTTPAPVGPEPVTPFEEDDDRGNDDDDSAMVMYEYVGCYADTQADRVLENMLSSDQMTPEFCYAHCSALGAVFMSTQYSFECFCSVDEDLDYERHGRGVCDMPCIGDESGVEMCGGRHAFDLYTILPPMVEAPSPAPPTSSECSGRYQQCGGQTWEGPTCCEDGYDCVKGGAFYSQCRPST